MNTKFVMSDNFTQAAAAIAKADALIFAAGAGMGVDSGLPDFRGNEGFWEAYPPFAERGLSFVEVANPHGFDEEPETAWGFYGHRLNLYRRSTPHAGFSILREWAKSKNDNYFVFTSNVDGQFQKAGFEESRVVEVHGSIHHLQCAEPCSEAIWSAGETELDIDDSIFRAEEPLPMCPRCESVARPNVLMFGDGRWIWNRTREQEENFYAWQSTLACKELVIIECGAGTAVPTVRSMSEDFQRNGAVLIRINPRESQGLRGTISIECGALEGLRKLQELL